MICPFCGSMGKIHSKEKIFDNKENPHIKQFCRLETGIEYRLFCFECKRDIIIREMIR